VRPRVYTSTAWIIRACRSDWLAQQDWHEDQPKALDFYTKNLGYMKSHDIYQSLPE
jgi:hypothetical protein